VAAKGGARTTEHSRRTFGDHVTTIYLPHIKDTRELTTCDGYVGSARRVVRDLGDIRLDKLTRGDVERAYMKWLKKDGLGAGSVIQHSVVIKGCLSYAINHDAISTEQGLRIKRATLPRAPGRESTIPDLKDVNRIVRPPSTATPS
jgi:hypothetical protein